MTRLSNLARLRSRDADYQALYDGRLAEETDEDLAEMITLVERIKDRMLEPANASAGPAR